MSPLNTPLVVLKPSIQNRDTLIIVITDSVGFQTLPTCTEN